jgi:hypothetical protein
MMVYGQVFLKFLKLIFQIVPNPITHKLRKFKNVTIVNRKKKKDINYSNRKKVIIIFLKRQN